MTSEVIVPQPRTTINSPQDLISEGIRPRPRRIIVSRFEASFLRDFCEGIDHCAAARVVER